MKKLEVIEKEFYSPEHITYGVRVGENRGNSTITDIYIKSDSLEDGEVDFRIFGGIEREGLIKIFGDFVEILKHEV